MDLPLRKVYIRHREEYPESELHSAAFHGFRTLGVEIKPYWWIDDIDGMDDLGPEVGVVGYIGDVQRALCRIGRPIPPNIDYPEELTHLLGRTIVRGDLGWVRRRPGHPMFIKPCEHKLFTGFVWAGDVGSERRLCGLDDNTPVFMSECVTFVSEYRSFILQGTVIYCRRYKGDWSVAPNRAVVEGAPRAMKAPPEAYCLDWGVTDGGETLLVEQNEGFSFGNYGLEPVLYARMLSARWAEMAGP